MSKQFSVGCVAMANIKRPFCVTAMSGLSSNVACVPRVSAFTQAVDCYLIAGKGPFLNCWDGVCVLEWGRGLVLASFRSAVE